MSAHQPPPTIDEARAALADLTNIVARSFGQAQAQQLPIQTKLNWRARRQIEEDNAFLNQTVDDLIQERRAMLQQWTVSLVVLAFGLSIFGTFLTRSGLINSIHSFAQSPIGAWFLGFITAGLVPSSLPTSSISPRSRRSAAPWR